MLTAVAGFDRRDRHSLPSIPLEAPAPEPGVLRVVVSDDLGFAPLDDDVRRAFRGAVDRLTAAGVEVVEDRPGLDSSVHTWAAIALAEAYQSEQDAFLHRRDELTAGVVDYLEAGAYVGIEQYVQAQFARERIHRAYADLFARTGGDVLLTPTLGCEAFGLGRRHPEEIGGVPIGPRGLDWAPFLCDANLAGLPACALPMGLGDDGLPVSLQVLGGRCDDARVLAAAETIEQVLGFAARPVPGSRRRTARRTDSRRPDETDLMRGPR
jgi:Asp-tRNA(Asn)/Glu-tRNA(Gln) amidotransferase A subunit family amidase